MSDSAPAGMNDRRATRRDALLGGAALAGGGLALAGLALPARATAQSPEDEDLRDFLVEAISLEQLTVLAYATTAAADGIDPALKRSLTEFRDQEQAHATALRSAIDSLGFDPPDPPESTSDSEAFTDVDGLSDEGGAPGEPSEEQRFTTLLSTLDRLRTADELLEFCAERERDQLDVYLGQGPGLDSKDLSTTAAEIAGCQAQHLVVLDRELGASVPDALAAAAATAARGGAEE